MAIEIVDLPISMVEFSIAKFKKIRSGIHMESPGNGMIRMGTIHMSLLLGCRLP